MVGGWQECVPPLGPSTTGVGKVGGLTPGGLYNEVAFRYLLKSEFHRSQRSGLTHYLLFLYHDRPDGMMTPMHAQVIRSVVMVLSRCLRDTDYAGWYREGRVMGVVLTAMGKESSVEHIESLRGRIVEALRGELGDKENSGFQVRMFSGDEWAVRGEDELDRATFHA